MKRIIHCLLLFVALSLVSCEKDEGGTSKTNGYEYVDLNLPSGNLWATMNLEASSVEGFGGLYAFGEITSKSSFYANNYRYGKEVEETRDYYDFDSTLLYSDIVNVVRYSKYVMSEDAEDKGYKGFYDNKKCLDLSDDAAHVKMGGGWRIPSEEDWHELFYYCKAEFYRLNEVRGCKITSENGAWIFIPKAGDGFEDSRGDLSFYYMSNGTSEYYGSGSVACLALRSGYFDDKVRYTTSSSGFARYYGLPIRAVCK